MNAETLFNSTTAEVRKESYEKSKPEFSKQEEQVLNFMRNGSDTAWAIEADSFFEYSERMLITSIRRALNSLVKKKTIQVSGKIYNSTTNRMVTTYRIKNNADDKNS